MRENVKRTARGLLATAATVSLAVTLGAVPAYAGVSNTAYTKAGDGFAARAGRATFSDSSNYITVYDTVADGASAVVYYSIDGIWEAPIRVGTGAGTSASKFVGPYEGWKIEFYVVLRDNGVDQGGTLSGVVKAVS